LIGFSTDLYPAWCQSMCVDSGIDPELVRSGALVMSPFDEVLAREWSRTHDVRMDFVAPVESGIGPYGEPAVRMPDVYQVRNPRLIRSLATALMSRGVTVLSQVEVRQLRTKGHRIASVESDTDRWTPGAVITAAGAWTSGLISRFGATPEVFPVRGQMLLYKVAPGLLSTIVLREEAYAVPRVDGHILVGSTVELAGFDGRVTESGRRALMKAAETLFPPLGRQGPIAHWAGLRPGSPGNIPTIARHPGLENLFVNAGHYRYGLTMAPGSARLLASMMLDQPPPIDPAPYAWRAAATIGQHTH
jgi:glycine oxidase